MRTRRRGRLATTSSSAGICVNRMPSSTSCCRVAPNMDMQPSAVVLRQAPARQIPTCVLVLNRQQRSGFYSFDPGQGVPSRLLERAKCLHGQTLMCWRVQHAWRIDKRTLSAGTAPAALSRRSVSKDAAQRCQHRRERA